MHRVDLGRLAEAAEDARRSLAVAGEVGYPVGDVLALAQLSFNASAAGDHHGAVQLARQAEQITGGVPCSLARACGFVLTIVLIAAGDLAAAERVCVAALAWSRDAGDLWNQAGLLTALIRAAAGASSRPIPPASHLLLSGCRPHCGSRRRHSAVSVAASAVRIVAW